MATTTPCQPLNADTDQYLFILIRIFAAVGISYLLRTLYQLMKWPQLSHRSALNRLDAVAEENIGLDMDDTASASQVSLDLDFRSYGDGDLGIRMPEPAYHPRGRL
ncbi:MAG: hypothetical protein ALECFALPRED_009115 [Alectoria fallacina]|uniref:Uncharacterized protein n=1 Tax=Alectoria fallacina TaxID=1903189 RepID=A0A8H3F131_9LECA|nr:MAG: hypothetical protein ALECFALPRED_009115 [Alectoria fallacina]